MSNDDPIHDELHRGRTALRDASLAYATFAAGGSKRRTKQEAGADALRNLNAAIAYQMTARDSLVAALNEETAPVAPGTASDPKKGIHS